MLGTIVTAAGAGTRFGGEKILAEVAGRPLLLVTLARLRRVRGVGPIALVLPPARLAAIRGEHGAALEALGVTAFVEGGATRQDSVRRGLAALPAEADPVLVHDAVRPLLPVEAAGRAVDLARRAGAAIVAVPARDTLKRVDGELRVRETVERDVIWHAETPQVVRRGILEAAYAKAERDGFLATDEASLVEHLGETVVVVRGEPFNVKVTERADLEVVRALLAREEE